MAGFNPIIYGRFWVITEVFAVGGYWRGVEPAHGVNSCRISHHDCRTSKMAHHRSALAQSYRCLALSREIMSIAFMNLEKMILFLGNS